MQTAESSLPEEGASLRLELTEDEYEFDVCPMNYDDGRNPYVNPAVLNVYAGANFSSLSFLLLIASLLCSVDLYRFL